MADEFIKTKFYRKILTTSLSLSGLFASVDFFLEEGTKQSLQDVVDDIDSLENSVEDLKENILDILKTIAGEEIEETGEITDQGIKLGD